MKIDQDPSIVVWNHEESGELEPVTYFVATTFIGFLNKLYS
ncbi:hypothetical protein [Priestia flexa]|nr:hypothetical protein [Priestia flexa]